MKKMRVLVCLLLSFLLLFITACGGRQSVSEPTGSDVSSLGTSTQNSSGDNEQSESTTEPGGVTDPIADPTSNSSGGNSKPSENGNNPSSGTSTSSSTTVEKDTSIRNLGGRTINYVCFWPELKKGESQRANAYWKAKEAVEKKYNCKINYIYKSQENIDLEVIPSIMSGNPVADVFALSANRLYSLIYNNMLYPLSDCPQFDFSEDKWPRYVVEMATVNGKTYAMNSVEGPYADTVLLYNKDYFAKNGLPDLFELQQKGQFDWAALRKIAKDATKGDVKGFAMAYDNLDTCRTFIHANGGVMVTRDEGFNFKNTINSKQTLYALDFWQQMYTKDKSCTEQNGYDYCMNQFINGKAAIHCCELYRSETITNGANFEIGMALFPAGPDSNLPYLVDQTGGTIYVMSATVKNPQDVAMVWDAFCGADQLPWEEYYYDMYYSDEAMTSLRTYVQLVRKGKYILDYVDCLGDQYDIGLHAAFYPIGTGEMTPAQAIETAQGKLDAAIRAFKK